MVGIIENKATNKIRLLFLFILSQLFTKYKFISPFKKLITKYNQSNFIININKLELSAGKTIGSNLPLFKLTILLLNTLKHNSPESNIDCSIERESSFFEMRLKDNNTYSNFTKLLSSDKQKFLQRFIIPIERAKLIGGDYNIISYKNHKKELVVKIPVVYI
jgi:hypothetical protein